AVSARKAFAALVPWPFGPPSWARMAVVRLVVRPSWRSLLRLRRPHRGAVRMRRGAATLAPVVAVPSPGGPLACSRKSLKGANTMPEGTPPAEVDTKTSESERWQPEHCSAAELNSVWPRDCAVFG